MENKSQTTNLFQGSHRGKGALDAFLNLLSLVTMAWSAISFGGVIFQIINKYLGEPAFGYETRFSLQVLQFNVASVIIVVPIFLFIIMILHKNYRLGKLIHSGIYRWLTYLMLFVAVCNIIGSLVALVYKLLGGDYAIAFILKTLTVLLIASGIFGYYFYDLRRQDYSKRSQISFVAFIAVVTLSFLAVIGGFIVAGSPLQSRKIKFDQQRVRDLSVLKWQVFNYYGQNQSLPADLSSSQFERFNDPETGYPYEYTVIATDRYKICATFSLAAIDEDSYRYGDTEEWHFHKAGHQCFDVRIEEAYKDSLVPKIVPELSY